MAAPHSVDDATLRGAHAYVISLARRQDRRNAFMDTNSPVLAGLARPWAWYDAVDARAAPMEAWLRDKRISIAARTQLTRPLRRSHYEVRSVGAIGCYLSHIGVWRQFLAESGPNDVAFVLEDDAVLPPDMWERLRVAAAEWRPADAPLWHMYTLVNGILGSEPAFDGVAGASPRWRRVTNFGGTHAYFLTRAGAALLLEHALPIEMELDQWMARITSELPLLRVVCHTGVVAAQTTSVSDIHTDACPLCDVPSSGTWLTRAIGRSVSDSTATALLVLFLLAVGGALGVLVLRARYRAAAD